MGDELRKFLNFVLVPGHPRTSAARFLLLAALLAPEKFVVEHHLRNVAEAARLPKSNIHKQAQHLFKKLGLRKAWQTPGAKYRLVEVED